MTHREKNEERKKMDEGKRQTSLKVIASKSCQSRIVHRATEAEVHLHKSEETSQTQFNCFAVHQGESEISHGSEI